MEEVLIIRDVAKRLHKSERWLRDWLSRHPQDVHGRPFYRLAGRTKLFTSADVARILEALPCPQARPAPPGQESVLVRPGIVPRPIS